MPRLPMLSGLKRFAAAGLIALGLGTGAMVAPGTAQAALPIVAAPIAGQPGALPVQYYRHGPPPRAYYRGPPPRRYYGPPRGYYRGPPPRAYYRGPPPRGYYRAPPPRYYRY
jgi:hypothetical protein